MAIKFLSSSVLPRTTHVPDDTYKAEEAAWNTLATAPSAMTDAQNGLEARSILGRIGSEDDGRTVGFGDVGVGRNRFGSKDNDYE